MLSFHLVSEQSDLFAIAQDWQELLGDSPRSGPMADPNWLLAWWRWYGVGAEVAVGLLVDGERLVGLAPLCIRKHAYYPGLVFRRLQFMGVDTTETDDVNSTSMGFLARDGYEEAVALAFVSRIATGDFGRYDEVVLAPMDDDAKLSTLAQTRMSASGLRCKTTSLAKRCVAELPDDWTDYLQSLPTASRTRTDAALSAFYAWANEKGGWSLNWTKEPDLLSASVEALMRLPVSHASSEIAYASPRFTAFHRDYIGARSPSAHVEIAWLMVDNTPLAGVYTIRKGDELLSYRYGQASVIPPMVEIEVVINALIIKDAISRGLRSFELFGGETTCSTLFATRDRPSVNLRAAHLSWKELVRRNIAGCINRLQSLASAGRPPRERFTVLGLFGRPARH